MVVTFLETIISVQLHVLFPVRTTVANNLNSRIVKTVVCICNHLKGVKLSICLPS